MHERTIRRAPAVHLYIFNYKTTLHICILYVLYMIYLISPWKCYILMLYMPMVLTNTCYSGLIFQQVLLCYSYYVLQCVIYDYTMTTRPIVFTQEQSITKNNRALLSCSTFHLWEIGRIWVTVEHWLCGAYSALLAIGINIQYLLFNLSIAAWS